MLHSLLGFSHFPCYPQSHWAPPVLIPEWVVCVPSRTPWVSPRTSPVRLGVSPANASTPTGVFNQRFEALFPRAGTPGFAVCHLVHQLLPHQPAAALPTPLHNPPPHRVASHCLALSPPLPPPPVSAPPTGLGECFFFISLVIGLPYRSIFCQFWVFFVFKLSLSFWLCKEAQCVYLRLHLGWNSSGSLFFKYNSCWEDQLS